MGLFSTQSLGTGEESLFSMVADPSDGVQTSYRYGVDAGLDLDDLSSLSAMPTDWASDPSLASIMNTQELTTASDFAASQLDVDIAVATMQFDGGASEQICDLTGSASSVSGSCAVSTSVDNSVESFFTDEQRQSAA